MNEVVGQHKGYTRPTRGLPRQSVVY